MHPLAEYLIKVIICSALLSGYYWMALRNERFHYWNRFYLLAAWCISLVVPLIKWPVYVKPQAGGMVYVLSALPWNQPQQVEWWQSYLTISNVLSGLAVVVMLGMLFHFGRSIWQIVLLRKRNPVTKFGEIDLVQTREDSAPFSFFNWLFWRRDLDMESTTGQNMLKHELAHIHEKHSLDKVFAEIVVRVFWMNPVFWWMRKELYAIHEFIADSKSIESRDGYAFASMILQASSPAKGAGFVNPLFHSQLQRRLTMITTSKKPRFSYLRRITGLVFMTATILFTVLSIQKSLAQTSTATTTANPSRTMLPDSILGGVSQTIDGIPMVVYTMKNGNTMRMTQAEARQIGLHIPISAPVGTSSFPIQAAMQDTVRIGNKTPLIIVDGKPVSETQFKKLPVAEIERFEVKEYDAAIGALYGKKAANGVVLITTKIGHDASEKLMNAESAEIVISAKSTNSTALQGNATGISINDGKTAIPGDALILVDEKEISREALDALPPASIESITVLKGQSAEALYGEKGKKGIILITTKKDGAPVETPVEGIKTEKVFTEMENPPAFPGGPSAWLKYLRHNLFYPEKAAANGTMGVVEVEFIVDMEGRLSEIKALNDPGDGLAEEAVRVLKASPPWVPGQQNGWKVVARVKHKVTFR